VPEGATPKDGPSAGVTMASALLSLARNQPPKKGVAMTGELTLTGHVLPIGGVREKVIAARRQKIFELILPEANQGNFEELPEYLKEGITVHFAKRFADVAKVLF
jgi:ATP-dependent Lon protease